MQIDEVIESSGYSPSRCSEILLDLELQGLSDSSPENRYAAEKFKLRVLDIKERVKVMAAKNLVIVESPAKAKTLENIWDEIFK